MLVTVSDKKLPHSTNGTTIDWYNADVVTANDYYPFGSLMPGRKYTANNKYRYGFNRKENDNEVKGEGNELDYGMRIYDSRVGKFLSVDPLTSKYAMLTPYQFASNNPIHNIDLDGLEGVGFEANLDRWITELSNNKITPKQFQERVRAAAMGGMIGVGVALVVLDQVFTKGAVTKFLTASTILGHLYHNPSPDPAENERRKNEFTNDLIGLASGYVLSKTITLATRIVTSTGKVVLKTFSSASVRFSQSSVNDLEEVLVSMKKSGWKGEPIDIVKMKDGAYTTADNTRLLAAKKAGINIEANSHNYDDLIPEERAKTMLNKKGEMPKTWGEAIENRIQKQNAQFRKDYTETNGTYNEPKVGESKKAAGNGN